MEYYFWLGREADEEDVVYWITGNQFFVDDIVFAPDWDDEE